MIIQIKLNKKIKYFDKNLKDSTNLFFLSFF